MCFSQEIRLARCYSQDLGTVKAPMAARRNVRYH